MCEQSTTPDLVELARDLYAAANEGDIDAALRFYAADAVFEARDVGVFEGPSAIRSFWKDWIETYETFEIEPEEILDLGHGVVYTVLRQTARLADSGSELGLREAWVSQWVTGGIARVTTYRDADEARAAAESLAQERELAMSNENVDMRKAPDV